MNNLRKQHVVDRAFQTRVAMSLTAIAMLVPIVLLLGGYVVWNIAVVHNPSLAEMPVGWVLVGQLLREQWWLALLFVVTFFAFSFALVFYNTHRIAGPVYRFRWLLDELGEGRIHTRVQLRKGDYFENLAASFLRANVSLAGTLGQLKNSCTAISTATGSLDQPALTEPLSQMNRILDRYRVIAPINEVDEAGEPAEGEAPAAVAPTDS